MSPRTPRLTAKQVIKQLKKAGFTDIGQTGSHLKLFNRETRRTAIVPIHSSKIAVKQFPLELSKQSKNKPTSNLSDKIARSLLFVMPAIARAFKNHRSKR